MILPSQITISEESTATTTHERYLRSNKNNKHSEIKLSYPFVARMKAHNVTSLLQQYDVLDRKKEAEDEESDVFYFMIHREHEYLELSYHSKSSSNIIDFQIDQEWTDYLTEKAKQASEKTTQYNTYRMYSKSSSYQGISSTHSCIRNLQSSFQTLHDLNANYPHLVELIDIGDSYLGKYDILALKITNRNNLYPNKPKMFAMFGLHAREYAPPELGARFIEQLLSEYNIDADITTILDYNEIHVVLQANPDAREVAEAQPYLYRRKNMNRSNGNCDDVSFGVDLNRNFPFKWSKKGASTNPCSETYHGPYPASEPEVQAITNYLSLIYKNQTSGIFFDVHSYGRLDIWPYTYDYNKLSEDNDSMTNAARKLNYRNGHELSGPGSPKFIGVASGASLDYAYGEHHLMSHALELGDDFYQDCKVFESDIAPRNLDALLYAAKTIRDPFLLPLGPDVHTIILSSDNLPQSSTICVSVEFKQYLDDSDIPSYDVDNVIIYVDSYLVDGYVLETENSYTMHNFTENSIWSTNTAYGNTIIQDQTPIYFQLALYNIGIGQHTLHIQGRDVLGNVGPLTSKFFTVCDPLYDTTCVDNTSNENCGNL